MSVNNPFNMNIVTPSLDELMPKVDSRYTLVTLAAKRTRQMLDEDRPVTAERRSTKDVTNAMEEIFEDKSTYERTRLSIK